ncbi:translation initiation factor eIF4e [Microthyrium microscopicum]|uniref:Translation initiation factor eIF4e n=1 Tax=Microthyrium microscopicum TaxID=703497 RepID=A0A6A6U3T1_9PEZI|nr:translation initiation factor eIF4e [Microthyrium microscopicum]
MASQRPRLPLQTGSLPGISEADLASTASPARGREMRANLLNKLRAPPLVHQWEFWHDRQDRKKASSPEPAASTGDADDNYEDRLVRLSVMSDVREFWEVFNNFDIGNMPLRDSVHMFHKGVKPVWEDPRNMKGGAWTFRVPKEKAAEFWKNVALMAVGEKLQAAVASKRITFIDDICGVSLSVRFTSYLITIWNRDANHTEGKQRILETVLTELPPELQPRENMYYYKAHSEHAGFKAPESIAGPTPTSSNATPITTNVTPIEDQR